MIAFLVFSVIGGVASAGISLLGFDAEFWMAGLWYILGTWAGFSMSLVAFLLTEDAHQSSQGQFAH